VRAVQETHGDEHGAGRGEERPSAERTAHTLDILHACPRKTQFEVNEVHVLKTSNVAISLDLCTCYQVPPRRGLGSSSCRSNTNGSGKAGGRLSLGYRSSSKPGSKRHLCLWCNIGILVGTRL